mmetsp:Transcript_48909/g.129022  ORF Transcript_48909/g.129022 Transcript_48909/m.129022 type:complete len:249 (-) Transcript_48909:309-1055(-)
MASSAASMSTQPVGSASASPAESLMRRRYRGPTPLFIRAALRAMSPDGSCRKTRSRVTRGTRPHWSKFFNTAPGPTEGSWSGSPTTRTAHPSGRASRSRAARCRSSIDASSMTIASASSGLRPSRFHTPSCGLYSSSLWIVLAGSPTASASTVAARAVGHAITTRLPCARHAATIRPTVNVLPVPGPPVSSSSRPAAARRTASSCLGDSARRLPPPAPPAPPPALAPPPSAPATAASASSAAPGPNWP